MDTGLVMFQDYTPLQKKIMNSLGTAKKKKEFTIILFILYL